MTSELKPVVCERAERALNDHELLMRPIPYFDQYDRFQGNLVRLSGECRPYLEPLTENAARRVASTYAFADELSRDVLCNFCPQLPDEGQHAHRLLWASAVLLDHMLDEQGTPPDELGTVREWVAASGTAGNGHHAGGPGTHSAEVSALIEMLERFLVDCRRRGQGTPGYREHKEDLVRLLDAELMSVDMSLGLSPGDGVRRTVYDKSVFICWVGLSTCLLGCEASSEDLAAYRDLSNVVGEILWMIDDLVDLEEDLDQGVWNRMLWIIHDLVGEVRFRELLSAREHLAALIISEALVEQAVSEIAHRVALVASEVSDPLKLRTMFAFWLTSWIDIYAQ